MTAGYTVVEYGDLKISNCLTRAFRQEAVFDDSGTDLLYWRFTVAVTGYSHSQPNWSLSQIFTAPYQTHTNAAASEIAQRSLLSPRRPFIMRVGVTQGSPDGQVLLSALPLEGAASTGSASISNRDVNNGPRCTQFSVTQITGNDIFRIEAEFEICKVECNSEGLTPNNSRGVLSNRWSCVDDIDQDYYTTRTYQGRLRMATASFSPHSFRDLVVPPLPHGMKRAHMHFAATPDGMNLDYAIVDREVAFSAPWPATSWAVRHTENVGDGNLLGTGEISVYLAGDRNVDKSALIKLALSIYEAKLLSGGSSRTTSLSITDEIGDRSAVSLIANVQHLKDVVPVPVQGGQAQIANADNLGKPINAADIPNYNAIVSGHGSSGFPGAAAPLSGPISLIGIFRSYLQTPCNDVHGIAPSSLYGPIATDGSSGGSQTSPGDSETRAVISEGLSPIVDPVTSSAHRESVYTYWQMESTYKTHHLSAALPVASMSPGSPGGSPGGGGQSDPNAATTQRVRLGQPQMKRILRVKGERVGELPQVPFPTDYTDNGVQAWLMEHSVRIGGVTQSASGQPIYRVDAEYEWVLSRALRPDEQWRIGANPWDVRGLQRTSPAMFTPEVGNLNPSLQSPGQQ